MKTEDLREKLKEWNPNIVLLGEFGGVDVKTQVKCKICGNVWESTPSNLLKYRGCPACSASKGEKFIAYYLKENNIAFIPQKRFDDCKDKRVLPFDFYLPSFNMCIEFDGQQHFSPDTYFGESEEKANEDFERLKRRDNIKNNYCAKNNITLIRIPYWEVNNISILLDKIFNKGRI